jgi:hypothetical protein
MEAGKLFDQLTNHQTTKSPPNESASSYCSKAVAFYMFPGRIWHVPLA